MAKKKDETVEEKKTEAAEAVTEEKSKKAAPAKASEKKDEKPRKSEKEAKPKAKAATGADDEVAKKGATKTGKRAEKVGIVFSDKMMKTVVVRVDRTVKHALYHKYMKRRKKFLAHDEMGASMGDRVRIVETRPLSARKRWRVVEIIQKAEK